MWFGIELLLWQQSICQSDKTISNLLDSPQAVCLTKIANVQRTFSLVFSTEQESNSTHLPDFELGCAPLRGRDVPPERPRPVLLPLRLLAALPVLVPPCTIDAHCIKPDVNRSRAAPGSGPAYPRRTRGPCRPPRGNATRQSPPGTSITHMEKHVSSAAQGRESRG